MTNHHCDDCGDQEAVERVQCPVDDDLRLDLCEACYDERGPGIEVCHVDLDDEWEVNGERVRPSVPGGQQRHLNNTVYPEPGWLGNPYDLGQTDSRTEGLRKFRHDLLQKCREEPFFVHHLSKIRGKQVACRCRTAAEERTPETRCHLDVVHAALMGLYRADDDGTSE